MARKDNRGRNLKTGEIQRQDGLYLYRYKDIRTGKRITIYDHDLASLRRKEKQVNQDLDDDIVTDHTVKTMTVNDLFTRYMESKNLALTTQSNYNSLWNSNIKDELGVMKVIQVKPSHIELFYSKLTKKGYAHSTIKVLHGLIYPSFEMAVRDDIIRKNPARISLTNKGRPSKERIALTPLQQNNLFAFVKFSNVYEKYLPMLTIMISIGCRCGELIGLTWNDVDMEKRQIHITHQLVYKNYGDGCKFHVTSPKTKAGIRDIPMTDTVYEAFQKQKQINVLLEVDETVAVEDMKGFIFVSKNGRPLMPSAVNNILYNIVKAYNEREEKLARLDHRSPEYMPTISAHIMRHTSCTRMAEQGLDMKVVQYIMGHAHIDVTMEVYNHITEQARIEKELARFQALEVI